jgi:acyl-CoA reductase-like NAD-dependent aldehyde dehydrogenase
MFEYAVYVRTKEGYVERMNNIIYNFPYDPQEAYGSLAPYVHEEKLVGFPESVVLWENTIGPSVGIAPINPPSHSADSALFPALLMG